jgi:hypothetical protein
MHRRNPGLPERGVPTAPAPVGDYDDDRGRQSACIPFGQDRRRKERTSGLSRCPDDTRTPETVYVNLSTRAGRRARP